MSAAPAVVAAGSSTKKKRKSEAAAMDVDGVQVRSERRENHLTATVADGIELCIVFGQ
jgi:hypothetical protein